MKYIPLGVRKILAYAIVDDSDYENLSKETWTFMKSPKDKIGYARSSRIQKKMEKFLLPVPKGKMIDHINGNSLDNRRSNLRICTQKQNSRNKASAGLSQFKGVSWNTASRKWQLYIYYKNNNRFLGLFENERHAAMVYDIWAKDIFGEFAKLNFN